MNDPDRSLDEGIEVDGIQNRHLNEIPLADINEFEIDGLVPPPQPSYFDSKYSGRPIWARARTIKGTL